MGCSRNAIFSLEYDLPAAPSSLDSRCTIPDDDRTYFRLELLVASQGDADFRDEEMSFGGTMSTFTPVLWSLPSSTASTELTSSRQEFLVDVEANQEHGAIHARLRFCATEDCSCENDLPLRDRHEIWLRYEDPVYIGENTSHRYRVTEIRTADFDDDGDRGDCNGFPGPGDSCAPRTVDRCQIRAPGCLMGDTISNYCDPETGAHACE